MKAPSSITVLTVVAAGLFLALTAVHLKQNINSSRNLFPVHVWLTHNGRQAVADDVAVRVVSRWSELELIRSGDVWSFEPKQIRSAPEIVVDFPVSSSADDYSVFLSLATLPPPTDRKELDRGWQRVPVLTADANENADRLRYSLVLDDLGYSIVLPAIHRRSINWRGDIHLLLSSMLIPATWIGFPWLLAIAMIWFRQGMRREPIQTSRVGIQPQQRVDGLDHLRGFAILMVYGYHCLFATFGYDQFGWNGWFRDFDQPSTTFLCLFPLTFGFGGVAVFFAISGFCIHLSHRRSSNPSWTTYAWRRFFRIYPPYLVALLFFAFVLPSTRLTFADDFDVTQFYSRIGLWFNLTPATYWGVNGAFWSIAVESQLYLIYPLLLAMVALIGWRTALVVAFLLEVGVHLTAVWWHGADLSVPFALASGPIGYVFSWFIGAKLAEDFLDKRPLVFRRVPVWCWCAMLFVSLNFKPLAMFQFMLFSLTAIGIMVRLLEGNRIPISIPDWLSRHLAWVGTISFSLYLLHQPFLNLAPQIVQWCWGEALVHPILKLVSCVAVYPLIVGISWLLYHYMEVPSIAAGKWFVARRTIATVTLLEKNVLETSKVGLNA